MRRKYVPMKAWMPDGEWAWEEPKNGDRTVYEANRDPVPTGICDKNGTEFFRCDAPNPIGFLAEIEDD